MTDLTVKHQIKVKGGVKYLLSIVGLCVEVRIRKGDDLEAMKRMNEMKIFETMKTVRIRDDKSGMHHEQKTGKKTGQETL